MDTSHHQEVGHLWLAIHVDKQNNGFIYDLRINESYRGQGYATAAMKALELKAKSLGMGTLSLHVFRHNEIARSLYNKLGYETTSILMAKDL